MAKEVEINDGKMEEVLKHKLTQEDFDENPDLAKQGLNIGDEVDVPVDNGNEYIKKAPELGSITEAEIEEGESHRIVIQKTEDGSVFIHTKQKDESKDLTTTEIIGLLEVAKFDILTQEKTSNEHQERAMAEPEEIVLEEKDFELFPELKTQAGKEAGDKVSLPRFAVIQLMENRKK